MENNTAIRLNLEEIENVLNSHVDLECEYWTYKLRLNQDNIILNIFDGNEIKETYKIEIIEEKTDIKSLLQSIINCLYEVEINSRQNYINKTKAFQNRKIQSMALWMGRGKLEKVTKINEELVERYNTKTKLESELSTYKDFSRDFYNCLTDLCPTWKIEDIGNFVEKTFEIYSMDVDVDINEDNITVYYLDFNVTVDVNNYSKNREVFNELLNKINNEKVA